jgi:hypothetical protein
MAPATVNYRLTAGDHLYTDAGARAEMHIGPNAIRLNAQTNFGFLNLDDRTVQMRFTQGAMEVRLRALGGEDVYYEVDTPNGAISLLRGGDYRIDADPDRNAPMITVVAGDVEVTANGNSFSVHPRRQRVLRPRRTSRRARKTRRRTNAADRRLFERHCALQLAGEVHEEDHVVPGLLRLRPLSRQDHRQGGYQMTSLG